MNKQTNETNEKNEIDLDADGLFTAKMTKNVND